MNKVFLIGNLTRDPEMRSTQSGVAVCSFTVAVNRRRSNNAEAGQPEADFFRVTAWRELGENCGKYLAKGRKVGVTGSVSASAYVGQDGQARASLEVNATEVEFLTPQQQGQQAAPQSQPQGYYQQPYQQPTYQHQQYQQPNYPPQQHQQMQFQQPGQWPQQMTNTQPGSGFVQVDEEDLPF